MSARPISKPPARHRCSPVAVRIGNRFVLVAFVAGMAACAMRPADEAANINLDSAVAGWKLRRLAAPASPVMPAADAAGQLPPIQLTRPIAPETMARLRAEAESWYRSRNANQAKEAFAMLVELDPSDANAWFRLGNLHQQSNDIAAAARAYRKAADVRGGLPEHAVIRRKALVNLALLGLARARQAMVELEAEPLDADTAAARHQVATQYRELQGQASALAQPRQSDPGESAQPMPNRSRDRRGRPADADDPAADLRGANGSDAIPTEAGASSGRKPMRRTGPGSSPVVDADEARSTSGPVRIEYLTGGPKK